MSTIQEKEGIILSFSDSCDLDESRIREVLRPLEDYAAIPEELIERMFDFQRFCRERNAT